MLNRFKKERASKDKSRDYIQNIHDSVIRTEEGIKYLKEEHTKTNTRLTEHEEKEEKALLEICDKINNHTCDQSVETKAIVEKLSERTNIQNGHLGDLSEQGKALKEQGDKTEDSLKTLLSIAEGRKSLWKELGIVGTFIVIVGGLVFAGLAYWK
jgi:hypothetical protein